jgi:hypothetical protein
MPAIGKALLYLLMAVLLPTAPSMAAGPFGARTFTLIEVNTAQAPDSSEGKGKENTRLVSSSLALLLGPFAAHRIYLGTTPKVAIIYGVTFGGFGLLAITDLGHLLFTKDLGPYRNNDRVFMWTEPRQAPTPP